jgi:hypothetical protein
MIDWNIENSYYLAVIISSLVALGVYFLFMRRK